jgi:hypothetical protein
MKSLFLFIICLTASLHTFGQNISTDTLTWHVVQLHDVNGNVTVNYQCDFTTNGTSIIQWLQDDLTSDVAVTAQTGTWTNIANNGKVTYQITVEGNSGSLAFERTTEGVTISIDISQTSGGRLKHIYKVEQIN